MFYLDDIVAYFRLLCQQHPLLLHADTAGARVFEVRDLDNAFGALRTGAKEKDFVVRLVLPSIEYHSEANNARKSYQLGLMVAKYHGRRETTDTDVIDAITESERVADEFLERIVLDSRSGYALFRSSVDQVDDLKPTMEVLPALFDGSYSGVLIMFEFSLWRKITNDCDPVLWDDDVPIIPGFPPVIGSPVALYPAGENIVAGRLLLIDDGEALYFQPAYTGHYGRAFGVSITDATAGENVQIQLYGEVVNADFDIFEGQTVYAAADGALELTWPASGIIQSVGHGTRSGKLKIDFSTKIMQ